MIEIITTVLTLLVTIGLPAYLRYRKTRNIVDALHYTVDATVAHLATKGELEDAKHVQAIARTAIGAIGLGAKLLNDKRLKLNRESLKAAGALDLSAALAEAERHRAASEGRPTE